MITSDKRYPSLPEDFPEGDYKNKSDACMNLQASLFLV